MKISFDDYLSEGQLILSLKYNGILNDKLRGFYHSTFTDNNGIKQSIATTQFESTDARRAFPCFDEPEYKAVFSITIIADKKLLRVSNEKVLEEKEADLFTKYYNRDQVDAVSRVLDDKIKALEKFWNKLGCRTKIMSFEDHDYVLSLTSHLPHAVAYSIVKTAINVTKTIVCSPE